jgi:hypothetical protein
MEPFLNPTMEIDPSESICRDFVNKVIQSKSSALKCGQQTRAKPHFNQTSQTRLEMIIHSKDVVWHGKGFNEWLKETFLQRIQSLMMKMKTIFSITCD